ncbi:hypothetical protein BU14_0518s0017 [Porphyra umbilicalis]|uniref:Helicase C-terminal domain-containing protein n=1 Tax=Porphyra umbilicalis TaxID=2786 RepID=A0A1X6NSS3_PORUM|nr:hypothetical protein BU14_0518s0017 [Porphyra umbilicalis]|eukprot:OSX71625.1 hypothetical protein BU14_0518s0017 [Porphyra umbilicalis]
MVRRAPADVAPGGCLLPPVTRARVVITPPASAVDTCRRLGVDAGDLRRRLDAARGRGGSHAGGGGGDVPPPKVAVFASHTEMLAALSATLTAAGVRHVLLDGATRPASRAAAVDAFQTEPAVRVALLGLRVAGAGLTLTAADVVLFAECPWSAAEVAQAEGRAVRLGRTAPVRVEVAVAVGTGDDALAGVLSRKYAAVAAVVDGAGGGGGGGAAEGGGGGSVLDSFVAAADGGGGRGGGGVGGRRGGPAPSGGGRADGARPPPAPRPPPPVLAARRGAGPADPIEDADAGLPRERKRPRWRR